MGILFLAIGLALLRDTSFDQRVIGPLEVDDLINLASYFFAGAALSLVWRLGERYAILIGAAGLILLLFIRDDISSLQPIGLAACIIGLGRSRAFAWFARGGDGPYGMYVFAWPVQQISLHLIGSFWLSLTVAFAVTAAIGYATWHGSERRALMQRDALAEFIRSAFRRRRIAASDPA